MAHPNEDVARGFFEAFADRDLETAAGFLAEDLKYHLGGATALSGTRTGRDSFLGLMDEVPGIQPSFELHDVVANDEHAVILMRARHRREGKDPLDAPGVFVMHTADGKITDIWSFPFDQAAVAEFLS